MAQNKPGTVDQLAVGAAVIDCNATAAPYPSVCLHELISAQAKRTPDAVAVVFEDRKLTYRELDSRSNRLANYLRKLGVGPEVLVGLCVQRSEQMVVALLAILKAGGAYVPLDPAFPGERLAYILGDADAKVLLTEVAVLGALTTTAKQLCIDGDWQRIERESDIPPNVPRSPANLAYVLYTSGSTGKPKGVQIEHRAVVNFLCSMQREPECVAGDVLVAVTTLSFDIAGLELYLPLISGATVVVASRDVAVDPARLMELMDSSGATMMQATPATWRMLLDADWKGRPGLKILCGGEAFPPELARQLLSRCASLWNMYGPTETTIWSSVYRVEENVPELLPIGHPIANTQMYILDDKLNPVEAGLEGELYIGGDGLARGYFNRPELTSEKFVGDRFAGCEGARMYRTGDLARRLPDGNIVYLGRIDNQVKIRGYRVELGEIEAALAEHKRVTQAVVVARDAANGSKQLVAYVVIRGLMPLSGNMLRSSLREQLPEYMIPSAFVLMESLPLTPNGKIDRKALPAPTRENSALESEYVAPRNEVELKLAQMWEAILNIRPIGIHDNLFDLGVNSLVAARLFADLEKSFRKRLPPGPLFQAPTIAQLAELLRTGASTSWTSLVPIQPNGKKTPLFCVHGGAGTVLLYNDLARALAPNRPLYGLQAQGLYGKAAPHSSIPDMARHYIREMRSICPGGPYVIGGWCFGALVALEMAQQLHAEGEEATLLLFSPDPRSSDGQVRMSVPFENERKTGSDTAGKKNGWSIAGMARVFARTANNTIGLNNATVRQLMYRLYVASGKPLPENLRDAYFIETATRAEQTYVPRPFPGRAIIFQNESWNGDSTLGWSALAPNCLEVCEIPRKGKTHRGLMLGSTATTLAEKLEQYLEKPEVSIGVQAS